MTDIPLHWPPGYESAYTISARAFFNREAAAVVQYLAVCLSLRFVGGPAVYFSRPTGSSAIIPTN